MGNPVFYFGNVPALEWYSTYQKHPPSPFLTVKFIEGERYIENIETHKTRS